MATYCGNIDATVTQLGAGGLSALEVTAIEAGTNPNQIDYTP